MTDDTDDTDNTDNTDGKDANDEPDETDELAPNSLGALIRAQRELANMSLRQLSSLAEVSNAYISQIERGLHEPSVRVLKNVGAALGIPPETLLSHLGLDSDDAATDTTAAPQVSTEEAILADPHLSQDEKRALLTVYRSYRGDST